MLDHIRRWFTGARRPRQAVDTSAPAAATPQTPNRRRCGCAQPPLTPRNGIYVTIGAHGINLRTVDGR